MTVALTLGKFAPFHRGHQRVIDTALAECSRVVVLAYDAPEVTSVPLPVRAGWIRRLYPAVEVVEIWDGPAEIGDDPDVRARHEKTIFAALERHGGPAVTHFYSSEPYGAHVSDALGAVDRRVDPERLGVPASGTAIRADPWKHRALLAPEVYGDLVARVVFLGAPSTGKTTLAKALAERYSTVWMPEYGRDYWLEHQVDRRLTPEQLVEIAEGHRQREEALLLEARRFLFVDTDATTTRMFALDYHDSAHPRLEALASDSRERYDLFVVCRDDIPYDDTWERSGAVYRERFHRQTLADLLARRIPFITVEGSVENRLARLVPILDRFDRFRSLGDQLLAG